MPVIQKVLAVPCICIVSVTGAILKGMVLTDLAFALVEVSACISDYWSDVPNQ